jgi:hypothetical protein
MVNWQKHEGELTVVGVGAGSNDVWGVNHLGHVYHWDGHKWDKVQNSFVAYTHNILKTRIQK